MSFYQAPVTCTISFILISFNYKTSFHIFILTYTKQFHKAQYKCKCIIILYLYGQNKVSNGKGTTKLNKIYINCLHFCVLPTVAGLYSVKMDGFKVMINKILSQIINKKVTIKLKSAKKTRWCHKICMYFQKQVVHADKIIIYRKNTLIECIKYHKNLRFHNNN